MSLQGHPRPQVLLSNRPDFINTKADLIYPEQAEILQCE